MLVCFGNAFVTNPGNTDANPATSSSAAAAKTNQVVPPGNIEPVGAVRSSQTGVDPNIGVAVLRNRSRNSSLDAKDPRPCQAADPVVTTVTSGNRTAPADESVCAPIRVGGMSYKDYVIEKGEVLKKFDKDTRYNNMMENYRNSDCLSMAGLSDGYSQFSENNDGNSERGKRTERINHLVGVSIPSVTSADHLSQSLLPLMSEGDTVLKEIGNLNSHVDGDMTLMVHTLCEYNSMTNRYDLSVYKCHDTVDVAYEARGLSWASVTVRRLKDVSEQVLAYHYQLGNLSK